MQVDERKDNLTVGRVKRNCAEIVPRKSYGMNSKFTTVQKPSVEMVTFTQVDGSCYNSLCKCNKINNAELNFKLNN